jgi:hypothetical protein
MAQVSGIEVSISGNPAGLERALGKAEGAISRFSKTAMAGLAGALSAGVFVAAGKAAINYADSIGKMSQKIGMTTEELSKLNYAAKLSDVSLGELQMGLQQLSKNMEAGSEGLAALGISATDASGNLRSTNDVMLEVAEAFAGMEDGAGKTAIAMNIFGRAGANLIPLLNSGRTGLAQMAGEAENFGVVISDDAAKAAEQFNDNLTRLQTAAEGLAQKILNPVLPSLIEFTNKLLALADTSTTLSDWFQNLYSWFEGLDPRIRTTRKEIEAIAGVLESMGLIEGWASPKSDLPMEIDIPGGDLPESGQKTKAPALSTGKDSGSKTRRERSPVPGVAPSQEVGMFFIDRLEAIRDGFKSEREVLEEEYNLNQAVLDNALLNKAIKEQEYYDLSQKLAEEHAAALAAIQQASISQQLSDLSSGFGSMASAFQNGGKKMLRVSKAFAAAQAIVATIQAAVDAMKNPALIDPASKFAAYAAVFAKGMSAVAAIRGVSDSGGGGGGGGGGRGGGRGGAASSAPAAASPTTTFSFTLMNDPMGFGEKFARQFIDQLNSTQRNGGQIRGVIA